MLFSKQQSSTDLHTNVHNSGKLNASAKFVASHYRARFTLPEGTTNLKLVFVELQVNIPKGSIIP